MHGQSWCGNSRTDNRVDRRRRLTCAAACAPAPARRWPTRHGASGALWDAASLKPHPSCSPAASPSNRRPCVLLQQIAERLLGKLLKRFLGLAREQVERVPSLRIELDQLSAGLRPPLWHDKPPLGR